MKTTRQIQQICDILRTAYPDVKTQLLHRNPYELLISTILSAQCTDRQVNAVTPALFKAYSTPEALARASIGKIETLIRSTGFFHNKAKNIKACAGTLVERFGGIVPDRLEALVTLPWRGAQDGQCGSQRRFRPGGGGRGHPRQADFHAPRPDPS